MQIHRTEVNVGIMFTAPYNVTFDGQVRGPFAQETFSVWHTDDPGQPQARYIVLPTGQTYPGAIELVATVICADRFHAFHLCRILA